MSDHHAEHDCTECPLTDRRDFLVRAGLVIAGVGISLHHATPLSALAIRRGATPGHTDVTYAIPSNDGVLVDKDNDVILVKFEGYVYAFARSCPHQNTALKWLDDDHAFQCPKHKSRYKPDGTFVSGRATRGMDRLAIRRDDKNVVVTVDTVFQQDKEPDKWTAAAIKL